MSGGLVSPGNVLKPAPDALGVRLRRARHIARDRHIFVTDIEARLGTRYTIDTVTALQKRFPRVHFIWLMGSDNLEQFSRWRRWQAIADRIPDCGGAAVPEPCSGVFACRTGTAPGCRTASRNRAVPGCAGRAAQFRELDRASGTGAWCYGRSHAKSRNLTAKDPKP
jgi:nicotinate-nucleotide adenylyltransferase